MAGQKSQIDRLIALASEPASLAKREKSVDTPEVAADAPAPAPEEGKASLWKSLSHLKSALPYVSKLLPLLDARFLPLIELLGGAGQQNAALAKEMREDLAALEVAQRQMTLTVQAQAVDVKAIEEQVTQLRGAVEANLRHQANMMREVRSMATLIRAVSAGLAVLLVVAIIMLGTLLARH